MTILYQCPRCGYEIGHKQSMKYHLSRKKICKPSLSDIELTEEIRKHVLDFKVCKSPPTVLNNDKEKQNVYNINNQNNIFINFSSTSNDFIKKYENYANVSRSSIESSINQNYQDQFNLYKKKPTAFIIEEHAISNDDLLHVINKVSECNDGQIANVLFDENNHKYLVCGNDKADFEHGTLWETTKRIVFYLKLCYLQDYEKYIVRNMVHHEEKNNYCKFLLKEYYKFLFAFEQKPFICGSLDNEIMFNEDEENFEKDDDVYSIEDKLNPIFLEVKATMPYTDVMTFRQNIMSVVKRNSKHNSTELNKNILDLINMDEQFKHQLTLSAHLQ